MSATIMAHLENPRDYQRIGEPTAALKKYLTFYHTERPRQSHGKKTPLEVYGCYQPPHTGSVVTADSVQKDSRAISDQSEYPGGYTSWLPACGLADESSGPAFALRDAWTARGQPFGLPTACPHSPASRPQSPRPYNNGFLYLIFWKSS
uniref:Integrase core domain-containing protein n=1 Tax=Candidatus Kentrum sp. TC TaxID=2126339 RepID=A0A450YIN3_9GAMM|nr:MAG: hypothetical protein BECKTC1821D_GA0114238_101010 [Candidatus Kentron sp. TC]